MYYKLLSAFMAFALFHITVFAGTPLSRGTMLAVRLSTPISSKGTSDASPRAIVENDVRSRDGALLIKRGTPVQLQVDRQKARGVGRPGVVKVNCVSTTAVDGQQVMLEGATSAEGDSKRGLALGLGLGLGLTIVLPGVGLAFLALKGKQATLPANTIINQVMVTDDYSIALQ